jgi:tRNA (guanine37-N1)-methyltransferase
MRFDVITIFPQLIEQAIQYGILGRAVESELLQVVIHNLRDYCHDRHRQVDDTPYGGGPGMVMKPEPFFEVVRTLRDDGQGDGRVVLLSPQGQSFNQQKARQLGLHSRLILLCARYEGIDERVRKAVVDEEISIGDYVLSGGEFAALVVMDAVARMIDGVLGNEESAEQESHTQGLLEYPQYTRPAIFEDMAAPDILIHGHHEQIRRWRRMQALKRTLQRRPDLLVRAELTDEDWQLLGTL